MSPNPFHFNLVGCSDIVFVCRWLCVPWSKTHCKAETLKPNSFKGFQGPSRPLWFHWLLCLKFKLDSLPFSKDITMPLSLGYFWNALAALFLSFRPWSQSAFGIQMTPDKYGKQLLFQLRSDKSSFCDQPLVRLLWDLFSTRPCPGGPVFCLPPLIVARIPPWSV